jgi:hypothetical protein
MKINDMNVPSGNIALRDTSEDFDRCVVRFV